MNSRRKVVTSPQLPTTDWASPESTSAFTLHSVYAAAQEANQLTRPGSTKTHVCSKSRTPPSAQTHGMESECGGSARRRAWDPMNSNCHETWIHTGCCKVRNTVKAGRSVVVPMKYLRHSLHLSPSYISTLPSERASAARIFV